MPLKNGTIITFYSYKGGTGRTMALANSACLLAEKGNKVLMIDWDLEAPGLTRYFPNFYSSLNQASNLGLSDQPGLIDLFNELDHLIPTEDAVSEDQTNELLDDTFSKIDLSEYFTQTNVHDVYLMPAGKNHDNDYSSRVGIFNWEDLFNRAPLIYQQFAERLAEKFDYVLIDSRTGVSDISGICTSLLPEKLVVVFTPNQQSLTGISDLVVKASAYRRNSDDLRPLLIYPLPSRIEGSLEDLRRMWRLGDPHNRIVGYKPLFEKLFKDAYGLSTCDLEDYFKNVQIQQTPDYAYGEEIAVNKTGDRFSLGSSYRVFLDRLISKEPPWGLIHEEEQLDPNDQGRKKTNTERIRSIDIESPEVISTSQDIIYMSYSRADQAKVAVIAENLQAVGYDVNLDYDGLLLGESWQRKIQKSLDEAVVIIVCWSRKSVESEWVRSEASYAMERNVLLPVLLDEVRIPMPFNNIHTANLVSKNFESGMLELISAIEKKNPNTRYVPKQPNLMTVESANSPRRTSTIIIWLLGLIIAMLALILGYLAMWSN